MLLFGRGPILVTTDTPRYSTKDLEDAEVFYHDEIAPQMRAEELAPEQDNYNPSVAASTLTDHQDSLEEP